MATLQAGRVYFCHGKGVQYFVCLVGVFTPALFSSRGPGVPKFPQQWCVRAYLKLNGVKMARHTLFIHCTKHVK